MLWALPTRPAVLGHAKTSSASRPRFQSSGFWRKEVVKGGSGGRPWSCNIAV